MLSVNQNKENFMLFFLKLNAYFYGSYFWFFMFTNSWEFTVLPLWFPSPFVSAMLIILRGKKRKRHSKRNFCFVDSNNSRIRQTKLRILKKNYQCGKLVWTKMLFILFYYSLHLYFEREIMKETLKIFLKKKKKEITQRLLLVKEIELEINFSIAVTEYLLS